MLEWMFGKPAPSISDDDANDVQAAVGDLLCGATSEFSNPFSAAKGESMLQKFRSNPSLANVMDELRENPSTMKRTNGSASSDTSEDSSRDEEHGEGVDVQLQENGGGMRWWSMLYLFIAVCLIASIGIGISMAKQSNKQSANVSAVSSANYGNGELPVEDSAVGESYLPNEGGQTGNQPDNKDNVFQTSPPPIAVETPAPQSELAEFAPIAPPPVAPPPRTPVTSAPTLAPSSATVPAAPLNEVNGDQSVQTLPPEILSGDRDSFYDYTAQTDYLVGVYYYPWHGSDFHNRQGYLRRELLPPHQPALGEYDDSRPEVIAQHMKWFRKANIGLLVTSWWGPNRVEDTNTKDVIMQHEDIGNLKIALHYETSGRIRSSDMSTARSDIQYICQNYFDHPNYYKVNGRPVLVIYVSRKLHDDGILEEALLTMRSEANKWGHNVYLIGDQVFAEAPNETFIPFWYFDAVTNYDVYGSSGEPGPYAGTYKVDNYYSEQARWRELAIKENCRFIPCVSPGYNDRAVRIEADHGPLSRRLSPDAPEGSLFQYQLTKALPLVDREIDNLILVNSFNEWHEDTQIEPAVGVYPSSLPWNLTLGVEYVGYEELYLDILYTATARNP